MMPEGVEQTLLSQTSIMWKIIKCWCRTEKQCYGSCIAV